MGGKQLTQEQFIDALKPKRNNKDELILTLSDADLTDRIELPLKQGDLDGLLLRTYNGQLDAFPPNARLESIELKDCTFEQGLVFVDDSSGDLTFINCHFQAITTFEKKKYKGKLRFRHCTFKKVKLFNAVFEDLVDFYDCEFYEEVIFLKTDFLKISVFAACTFHRNTLFTYSLIEKLVIFRSTTFVEWLDLSLSIGDGKFNLFDMKPEGFKKTSIKSDSLVILNQKDYDKAVTEDGVIPLKNKRETLRILKQTLVTQGNISESLEYKRLEKETLRQELRTKESKVRQDYFDQFILFLNRWSNNHGVSYLHSVIFILVSGGFFFNVSLCSSTYYSFTLNPCDWDYEVFFTHFPQFLLPTHRFTFMDAYLESMRPHSKDLKMDGGFYILDFLGRLFISYGIYQFIQAFRKYR